MLTNKISGQKKRMNKEIKSFPIFKSINDKSSLLSLKPGYNMSPSPQEIFEKQFMVNNLTIRNEYAEVTWRGAVDLRKLKVPLESLIDLGPTHIEVYPDERVKPLAGTELNKICFVTFKNLKRISNRKLRKICDGNGCELLQADRNNENFTVQIPHFTIYKFTEEAKNDSESEEKSESNDLVKNLKEKNEKQLLHEQENERETHFNDQSSSRFQPTEQFLERVESHNQKHGHMMSHSRIRGSEVTAGFNGVVSSASEYKNTHFALFSLPKEVDRSEFNMVEKILKDENEIMLSIISPETPFQVKSVLSLNAICFGFENIKFDFIKRSGKIEFIPITRAPDNHYQKKYLGNWFEWVINESESTLELSQNDIIRALCLRKGAEMAEKLLNLKRNDDAEFLSKIEDESFRSYQTVSSLCQELRNIENGEMSLFNDLEWIVKLGVFIWYFLIGASKTEGGHHESIQNILLENTDKEYRFELERQILLTFLDLPLPLKRKGLISNQNLPLWWLISNSNNDKEKNLKHDPSEYREYRCELTAQICNKFADSFITLEIISHDKYLEKYDRSQIIKNFIESFPEEAMRIPIADWKEYSDLVYEYKGIALFGKGRYFEALKCFSMCRNLSSDAEVIVKEIACVEEIICGFHRKTIEKSKRLLEKLSTTVLEDELLFMSLILGEQQIDETKARKVINFCYNIHQEGLRRRMLESVFKLIISNPTMIVRLKKDAELEGLIDEIYKDPSYRLQLKLAKLES